MERASLQRDRKAVAARGTGPLDGGRVVNRAADSDRLSIAEAVARLGSVYEFEEFSPLGTHPLLVVDARLRSDAAAEAAVAAAERALVRLACPTVVVADGPTPDAYAGFLDRFDVVVADDVELARVRATVERAPLASMALVQLLRRNEGATVHEGLIAESLAYSTLQSGPEFARWQAEHARRPGPGAGKRARGRRATGGPAVVVERDGAKLTLILDRPERRNAFSVEMRDGLTAALSAAVTDDSVEEIVVRGAGEAFCSGGDLDEFGSFGDPATAHAVRSTRNVARLLDQCTATVRFEVHGACVGAGAELAAFADRVVARRDAFFELPEVAMGLVPGAGGTVGIPRRIGRRRAGYLALSGVRIDSATALSWGLADELV